MMPSVVGATFMAPVVPVDHVTDVYNLNDGRAEAGPYDNRLDQLQTGNGKHSCQDWAHVAVWNVFAESATE